MIHNRQEWDLSRPTTSSSYRSDEATGQRSRITPFMGITHRLGKFSICLAELIQPLRELLTKKNFLAWVLTQESAFSAIKTELSKPTILGLYDSGANTMISAEQFYSRKTK